MTQRARKFRSLEDRLLQLYSTWQKTHQLQLAVACLKLLTQLMELNPHYSFRHPFDRAF
ncbi:MAG: hypothetical protein HYU34_00965 [Candidatus Omnitrophica bacterium]|nr:hypothetical protein [Candidatus Omnitrophota bacterium]